MNLVQLVNSGASELLKKYLEEGIIKERKHPTLDLWIYNYTHLCQFSGIWNELTLACRGLVLDKEQNVIAHPFKKFFNIEEHQYKVPNEPFDVFEKVDGSLGIMFFYDNQWIFASRGSFDSDQAIEMAKIWKEKYHYSEHHMDVNSTYLFEIIYPENRIVVDYGDTRELVLLSRFITDTGEEILPAHCSVFSAFSSATPSFRFAKSYHFNSIDDVLKSNLDNSEGYVVRFESGFRVKIKFAEYIRLHKLITEASTTSIWESLSKGDDLEVLLEKVPDEFYDWVKATKTKLEKDYQKIESEAKKHFNNLMRQKFQNRKDQANFVINSTAPKLNGILFAMLDEKEYSQIIWKMIKPEYEKPFWTDTP